MGDKCPGKPTPSPSANSASPDHCNMQAACSNSHAEPGDSRHTPRAPQMPLQPAQMLLFVPPTSFSALATADRPAQKRQRVVAKGKESKLPRGKSPCSTQTWSNSWRPAQGTGTGCLTLAVPPLWSWSGGRAWPKCAPTFMLGMSSSLESLVRLSIRLFQASRSTVL